MSSLSAPLPTHPKTNLLPCRVQPQRLHLNAAKRITMFVLAILSLVVGFVFFLIPPIPLGMPLFAISCTLMMKSSPKFQIWALKRTHRFPKINAFLKRQHEKLKG